MRLSRFILFLTHSWVPKTHCLVRDKFKKSSKVSGKNYFIPSCHLLVFNSQLDSPFVKKYAKNDVLDLFPRYFFKGKFVKTC